MKRGVYMDTQIIPGKRVGKYGLGITYRELIKLFQSENIEHKEKILPTCLKIETKDMAFLLENSIVTQITVFGDFKGKLCGTIGIGSSLTEVKEHIGDIKSGEFDIVPTYELKDTNGICFELKDDSDWDENKTPIDAISIFRP